MYKYTLPLLLLLPLFGIAQNLLPTPDSVIVDGVVYKTIKEENAAYYIDHNIDTFYLELDKMALFPNGGNKAMYKLLGENIKYPRKAKSYGISGKVFINFTVTKSGEIKDIKVLRGVHDLLDNEALRLVKLFPKWDAGVHNGKPVNVRYNLPINFALRDTPPSSMNPKAKKYINKADKYFEKKDYTKAIENYTEAILWFHSNTNAYYKRAEVYKTIGNIEKACQDWKRCSDFGDNRVAPLIKQYCY